MFELVWRFHFLCTLRNYWLRKFQTRNYIVDLVHCTQDFWLNFDMTSIPNNAFFLYNWNKLGIFTYITIKYFDNMVIKGLLHFRIWIVSSILDAWICFFMTCFLTPNSGHGITIIIHVRWRIDHWLVLFSWHGYKYRSHETKKYHQPKK